MNDRPDYYGDAEVKRIIARAAEIERDQGYRLDAPALRAIGNEAGISPAAVERAIAEHDSAALVNEPWLKRHRGMIIGVVVVVLLVLAYAIMRRSA